METVSHITRSGVRLQFEVHPHDANWNEVGGIYAFCHASSPGNWFPHYAGQTNCFKARIPQHEQWPPAKRRGATHVLVATVSRQADRDKIEADLIFEWQPPLNTQLR